MLTCNQKRLTRKSDKTIFLYPKRRDKLRHKSANKIVKALPPTRSPQCVTRLTPSTHNSAGAHNVHRSTAAAAGAYHCCSSCCCVLEVLLLLLELLSCFRCCFLVPIVDDSYVLAKVQSTCRRRRRSPYLVLRQRHIRRDRRCGHSEVHIRRVAVATETVAPTRPSRAAPRPPQRDRRCVHIRRCDHRKRILPI